MGMNQVAETRLRKTDPFPNQRFSSEFELNNQQMLKGRYDDVVEIQLD
jgi:hypothetical protein